MNCEEISELLPAYVLGALDADEMEAVEAHLRTGHEHDAELVDLRTAVFALDRFPEAIAPAPSSALAGRIGAIVEPGQVPQPVRKQPWGWFAAPGLVRSAAAALLLLFVFSTGWVVGNTLTGDSGDVLAYVIKNEDGAYMEVSGSRDTDSVTVVMDGLARLPDSSYQVWAIRDDRWISLGVCNTNEDGWWKGDFKFGLQEDEEFALTIEPRGGSERPTSQPVLSSSH